MIETNKILIIVIDNSDDNFSFELFVDFRHFDLIDIEFNPITLTVLFPSSKLRSVAADFTLGPHRYSLLLSDKGFLIRKVDNRLFTR